MTQDTDTNANATWRDYAEYLSPDKIANFEASEHLARTEAHLAFPGADPDAVVRRVQQSMLDEARNQVRFAAIPLPAGCDQSDTWQNDGTGTWSRWVFGPRRTIDHLSIGVDGSQYPDGSVKWEMFASVDDDPMTPEQARKFAAMLLDAASDFERLAD